jgi:[acyl-carrier-protein] S-malonyltransferase
VLAIIAPGQGAQREGFLTPWVATDRAADHLNALSRSAGIDLLAAGVTMTDAEITDTAVAQPLIVASALMSARLLPELPADTVYAGHSVGELAATALAGMISDADAVRFAAERGAAMARASAAPAGGMTAVLGGDPAEVDAAIEAAGCVAANHNAKGQVVAAGTTEALARLAEAPPPGARLRPLAVAGAFHSSLMAPARTEVGALADSLDARDGAVGVVSNADGTLIASGRTMLDRLVGQVCAPVRWDLCMQTLAHMGVRATIELAPAGTLTALVRRELPDVTAIALRTPDDLAAARDVITEQHAAPAAPPLPWRLVVAPARGTVHLPGHTVESTFAAGDLVVQIRTAHEELEVRAEHSGHLVEWLVHDGDPVNAGQPLARLAAEAVA